MNPEEFKEKAWYYILLTTYKLKSLAVWLFRLKLEYKIYIFILLFVLIEPFRNWVIVQVARVISWVIA